MKINWKKAFVLAVLCFLFLDHADTVYRYWGMDFYYWAPISAIFKTVLALSGLVVADLAVKD